MSRYAPTFPTLLDGFSLESLERDRHSIFALSPGFDVIYVNPAYCAFWEANGGTPGFDTRSPIGVNLFDAIAGVTRSFYRERLERVLASGQRWENLYACPSAETHREYHQGIYPLKNAQGLVIINSLKVERPTDLDARTGAELELAYLQSGGLASQCSNCRRTLRNDDSGLWDWVPAWIADLPAYVSHTICPPCFEYYWK